MTRAPVIVGAGLAGLVTALRCAERGLPVTVLCPGELDAADPGAGDPGVGPASGWAQGGIAAAVGADDDPGLHAADTLAAGAGLCDPAVVDLVTRAAPEAIAYLTSLGAAFDRAPDGTLRLGLEGAHGRHRIVHARGDGTGAEVLRAVVAAVRATPAIRVLDRTCAVRLSVRDGQLAGVEVDTDGVRTHLAADAVVLATGGSGALWRHTTNPLGSRGQGLALAARAGAVLRDLEMVQFHPTALDVGLDPMPLVSEAVRGAGAQLVDASGTLLTDDPLASRDVVARIVGETSRRGQAYLDARGSIGSRFPELFPAVAQAAARSGIDPATQLVPVRPAAHYHCGGVLVDHHGRSTVPGLWAVGEVASTGLHGANRLASNSLLEAVVFGGRVARDLARHLPRGAEPSAVGDGTTTAPRGILPVSPTGSARPGRAELRALLSESVGLLRSGHELERLVTSLREVVAPDPDAADDDTLVALLIADSALRRRESRGGHVRTDHPATDPVARHTTTTLAATLARAESAAPQTLPEPLLIGATR